MQLKQEKSQHKVELQQKNYSRFNWKVPWSLMLKEGFWNIVFPDWMGFDVDDQRTILDKNTSNFLTALPL